MLLDLLTLEPKGRNRFLAHVHQENFRNTLFGGQVLAQALMAAGSTCDRQVHSLHAYFLRPGKISSPVEYQVSIVRDGHSVSTRSVQAIQDDALIFTMLASFHIQESGFSHQLEKPPHSTPPDIIKKRFSDADNEHLSLASKTLGTAPIEFIPQSSDIFSAEVRSQAKVQFWVRTPSKLPDSPLINACALAFASDIGLLATTLLPHNTSLFSGQVIPASMDHSIWFHRQCQFHHWHQYVTDSPWAGGARGFCRGSMYNEAEELIASTSQEGLIRPNIKKPKSS